MKLAQSLRLLPYPSYHIKSSTRADFGRGHISIALVGSGGKTTALFQLARELTPPVIVTTTTHLHVNQVHLSDNHLIIANDNNMNNLADHLDGVTLITGPVAHNRMTGLDDRIIAKLRDICIAHDLPLLIEADGSRQRPLKAPAGHEPRIPPFVDLVIVVCGLSGLGKPLSEEVVHRPEIFTSVSGLKMGEKITYDALGSLLTDPEGGLKNIPPWAYRKVCLNQADTPKLIQQGIKLASKILPAYHSVLVASLKNNRVNAVIESIAGIILAAGGSSRFGQPKQLLQWNGKPFVRIVAETAFRAGLSPIVVVTGSNAVQVESALNGLPVNIVRNLRWKEGQSTSIRIGLLTLQVDPVRENNANLCRAADWGRIGASIFLLADQPQVTPSILRALTEHHTLTLDPIIAPLVLDQRANPVLFDRITFPDLMELSGDVGGRAIFSHYPVKNLLWNDARLLSDVDTPEEYEHLVNG